jgi:hypothetical protein
MKIELSNKRIDERKGEIAMEIRGGLRSEKWVLGAKLSFCTD